jgi:hypothetical protein
MSWLSIIIEALACSAMLFVAHGMPYSKNVIEPGMLTGSMYYYIMGLLYYAAFMLVPIAVIHLL